MPRFAAYGQAVLVSFVILCAPGGCGGGSGAGVDAGGPVTPASTVHCDYEPLAPTARAGGTVVAGPVQAGVAEAALELPVSSALGGNTSRATGLDDQGRVDTRKAPMSGGFNPSIGIETIPRVKALALTAGDETIVILKTDTIFSDDTITHEVSDRLGADFAGKVVWASSHSHTAAEQYSADSKLQVGGGVMRGKSRAILLDGLTETAQAALAARVPAKLGIAVDTDFDPDDAVSYDRRGENDALWGGQQRKDTYLAMVRVDRADGTPLAILPVLGNHSAVLDDDAALFSTDVTGMYERLLEEQFETPVTVMHLQGAAGDVLPSSSRHVEVGGGEPDMDFARSEENGRRALPALLALWTTAGEGMLAELPMEMLTRSVALGPDWRTFTVRGGALAYAPFEPGRSCDRVIRDDAGALVSPIDEFNARYGAGLCGDGEDDTFLNAQMPGVDGLVPYHSCATLPEVTLVLGALIDVEFEPAPLCSSTRTTVSALRLGEYLLAFAPGEPLTLWAEHVRSLSPVAPEKTIVVGYAQGHVGYILTADDWVQGGFEPTINLWGPLEGEYIAERLAELLALAVTETREDAAGGGVDRVKSPTIVDDLPPPDPAPLAGTVPAVVPELVYFLGRAHPASGQPAAQVARVTGVARFVWIGEDPLAGTPRLSLQREVAAGVFETVTRRSGRVVDDFDVLLLWTPDPLRPVGSEPRTHYWAAQWQAVDWLGGAAGAPGANDLAARAGLPLGRYRFHVEGTGYTVDSQPFEVVAGPLSVTASVEGATLAVTAAYDAREGWRLLALDGLSNRPLPVPAGPLRIEVTFAGGAVEVFDDVALSAPGAASVTPSSTRNITSVRVLDRFGNSGSP